MSLTDSLVLGLAQEIRRPASWPTIRSCCAKRSRPDYGAVFGEFVAEL
jgi:hypothetical protein